MAMGKCAECGHPVSTSASVCPYCGYQYTGRCFDCVYWDEGDCRLTGTGMSGGCPCGHWDDND